MVIMFYFEKHNKYMKIVKFNTLTFLLQLQLAIYNSFLYLKDLCNKEIDCLLNIIEKNFQKPENGWSVGFIPLETVNLS